MFSSVSYHKLTFKLIINTIERKIWIENSKRNWGYKFDFRHQIGSSDFLQFYLRKKIFFETFGIFGLCLTFIFGSFSFNSTGYDEYLFIYEIILSCGRRCQFVFMIQNSTYIGLIADLILCLIAAVLYFWSICMVAEKTFTFDYALLKSVCFKDSYWAYCVWCINL